MGFDDVVLYIRDTVRSADDLIALGNEVAKALKLQGRDAVFDVEVEAAERTADVLEDEKTSKT